MRLRISRDAMSPQVKTGGLVPLIVVPTLNEQAHIRACLMSLLPQINGGIIAVVDANSTDKTRQITREIAVLNPQVILIDNPKRIQSCGVNLAVKVCATDAHKILIRCDAHADYPSDFVDRILADFQTSKIASVVVPMDAQGQTNFAKTAAWIVDTMLGNGGSKHRGGHYTGFVDHGHHAGMDLNWFRKIGGYDESFSYNEDAEYDLRLVAAGGKIWMNGDIRIGYFMRPNIIALARQYFNYGRGRARTLIKHAHRPRLRQSVPTLNLITLLVFTALSLFWPVFVILPLAYGITLILISILGAIRLRAFAGLWAGPAVGVMHNAWAVGYLHQRLSGIEKW